MKSKRIYINAYGPANLFDLSTFASAFVEETGLVNGLLLVCSVGSTGALVRALEKEAFVDWVMSFAPFSSKHRHPGNAFAHLRCTILGSDISLAVSENRIISPDGSSLLENTAGRKQRPIEMRVFGEFKEGGLLNMKVDSNTFKVKSNGWIDIVDLSAIAQSVISDSGITDGLLHIESREERTAISTTEYESSLLSDTADFIAKAVDSVSDSNKGHVAATLLGNSINLPVKEGGLEVGTWQQPVILDFSTAGPKKIFFQVVGN